MITPSPTCAIDPLSASRRTNRCSLTTAAVILVALSAAGSPLRAQTPTRTVTIPRTRIDPTIAPKLKTFTPVDSLIVNPTVPSFTITLVHTRSGQPTEYRVSHFSDFRDASWSPYLTRPKITVPHSWFTPSGSANQSVTLYFQLRAKNPRGGLPRTVTPFTTEPRFFFSDVKAARIHIVFVG